jgi:TolB-like protein/Tfp pilus assembly protein PilF
MVDFLQRLRERKLVQWALAYIAAAFALIQVLDIVAQRFGWPQYAVRFVIIALAVGFFVVLVLAWYHGERGTQRVSGTELLILALLLTIGGAVIWRLAPTAAELSASTAQAATAQSTPSSSAAAEGRSIAVLAFTDLSPAHDQEYFSDGMAEEILNALAQVNDLKVAGRTSSFYYKGHNEDLRTIGKTLSVATILEGSVRKQGDRVRITAQLIKVADDSHLWSHEYDGDLSDVFRLQESIARAITDQLKVVLVGEQKMQLVPVATTSPEAHALYLQATQALNQRDYQRMGDAIGWLEQALKLDPNFARAHARLALIHVLGQARYGASNSEAERHAQLALALDPTLAETQIALSGIARRDRHFVDARAATDRALDLAPNDASVHLYAGQLLIVTGYTREGTAHLDRALSIDPLLPNALYWRGRQYAYAGDLDAAERMYERANGLGLSFANSGLGQVARLRGDYAKARELAAPYMFRNGVTDCLKNPAASVPIALEGVIGGDAAALTKARGVIDECLAAKPAIVPLWIADFLLQTGQLQRALTVIAQGRTSDDAGLFMNFWGGYGRDARRLPEFAEFARKVGFADVWDRYGAPDGCRRKRPGDFVCE